MRAWVGFVAVLVIAAGCLGSGGPAGSGSQGSVQKLGAVGPDDQLYPVGVHPYPQGDEWPKDLVGPFKRKAIESVRVVSNGVELDGWIHLPDVPEGVKLPTVLWSSPYFGQTDDAGDSDAIGTSPYVPVNLLVSEGYAVALFNVRGTGNSGGCFEFFGPNEQKDQARLVEYLASQKWSNGRVGMMGLSYHGTTPWEAAINNPPALKTIVVAGLVSDLYTFFHTPQGAGFTIGPAFSVLVAGLVSFAPPAMNTNQSSGFRHLPVVPGRACPEVVEMFTNLQAGQVSDVRDEQYWKDRNLIQRFPGITSSVFLTHGFQDNHGSGHQQQEDWVWDSLNAPKRWLEGQWGHEFPNTAGMTEWHPQMLEWFDFWLKGLGPAPPFAGVVDYQDGLEEWHTSTRWPPAEARPEVLYLADDRLSPEPAQTPQSFRSVPLPAGPEEVLCPTTRAAGPSVPSGFLYRTEPVAERVHIAGNPFAYLSIQSDLPGGLVGAHVYDLSPIFGCGQNGPTGANLLVAGVADLRFHQGASYQGRDFPTNADQKVRIDISSLSDVLEPGHRLALVVSFGDPADRSGQPFFPTITVNEGPEGSHLVVPIVEGTLGGTAPAFAYPPRPFLPPGVGLQ